MKNIIQLLLLLVACHVFAQKTDLVNAPENPIVLKYKLEHFGLKGDVYSYDYKYFFNKEGLLESKSDYQGDSTFEYENGKLVGDDTYYELKENTQGYIPRITKQKSVTEFTYNDKGLLINEVETTAKSYNKPEVINKITYSYDPSKRVINKEAFKDAILQTTTTYSYIKEGTVLKVFKKETENGKTTSSESRYKDGQLIYAKSNSDNIELKIEKKFDEKGNSIRDAYINNSKETDVFDYTILYFSDANKPINYTVKIRKAYNGKLIPQVQRNGVYFYTTTDIRLENTTDMLLFDGLTQTYYVAKNAYDANLKEGTVLNFDIISKGKAALLYTMANNSISAFYKGKNIFLNASYKKSTYIFDNAITCFTKKGSNNKKTLFFKDAKGNTFTAGELLPANKENMYYYLDGKQNTQAIVKEGERISPLTQLFGIKATQNGGLIGYINKDTVYCFPNYYSAERDIIYPVRLYDPKIDIIKTIDFKPNQTVISEVKPKNPANSLYAQKILNIPKSTEQHKQTKVVMQEMESSLAAKGFSFEQKNSAYVTLFNELYTIDKYEAYRVMMTIDSQYIRTVLPELTTEQKAFLKEYAREKINGSSVKK